MTTERPCVGVLALQGDVREHVRALERAGADVVLVRRAEELHDVDGLILPGGESTTIDRMLRAFDLFHPLREQVQDGLPVLGSCAGMILLADRLIDGAPDQRTVGGMDITVMRNAFGRQVDSFEVPVDVVGIEDGPVAAAFIRAPKVVSIGPGVEVLAAIGDTIVMVRDRHLMATAFHPELTGDDRVHRLFVAHVGSFTAGRGERADRLAVMAAGAPVGAGDEASDPDGHREPGRSAMMQAGC